MAVQIPFVREQGIEYEAPVQVSPLIRRVTARNPGPFTYNGTGVYFVGRGDVAVIDPGPVQPGHLEALLAALGQDRLAHIFVTHGHLDHSPMAGPLAKATGAQIHAAGGVMKTADHGVVVEAGDDGAFRPDAIVTDGQVIAGNGWTLEAVFTPGHTSNHMCYALREENALFSGDHIMGWSTTVITPPDGDMTAYFNSLEKVLARDFDTIWPTHGPPIRDVRAFVSAYIAHRREREDQILARLAAGQTRIRDMVAIIYAAVDTRLHPAAAQSVLAHMIKLTREGRVHCVGAPSLNGEFTLPA